MKPDHRLLVGLVICLVLLFPAGSGLAQESVTFSDLGASHVFGESLHFEGEIATTEPIIRLELFFRPEGGNSRVVPVMIAEGSQLSADYQINSLGGFQPFSKIAFWFVATLDSGEQVMSEEQTMTYSDNRYTWQSLENNSGYTAYWIDGDTSFGQAILDAAVNSIADFESYLTLPIPDSLELYIYPSQDTLQSALEVSGTSWTTGHANPAAGRAFAAIPNSYDYLLDMGNTISHEITHIRLYLLMGENYTNLPAWLNEGLAKLSERTPGDITPVLEAARNGEALFDLTNLCSAFPGDSEGAAVAYAQSEALVRYIFNRYGKIGLQTLVDSYSAGHSCENGVLGSLGVGLEELEDDWFQFQFGQKVPQTEQAAPDANEVYGLVILGALVFLAPVALILFTKRRYDKKEVINGNGS